MLKAENLACVRGGRLVFRGLHVALAAGGALIVQGPNGSGKSSLLRMMAGLLSPQRGMVSWDGQDIVARAQDHAQSLHFIGHAHATRDDLTVYETIRYWQALLDEKAGDAALAAFAIGDLRDAAVRVLSAGQKRRLALTRLLLAARRLWLLDEPTAGLDGNAQEILHGLLARHRAAGGLVVIATHDKMNVPDAQMLNLGAT